MSIFPAYILISEYETVAEDRILQSNHGISVWLQIENPIVEPHRWPLAEMGLVLQQPSTAFGVHDATGDWTGISKKIPSGNETWLGNPL